MNKTIKYSKLFFLKLSLLTLFFMFSRQGVIAQSAIPGHTIFVSSSTGDDARLGDSWGQSVATITQAFLLSKSNPTTDLVTIWVEGGYEYGIDPLLVETMPHNNRLVGGFKIGANDELNRSWSDPSLVTTITSSSAGLPYLFSLNNTFLFLDGFDINANDAGDIFSLDIGSKLILKNCVLRDGQRVLTCTASDVAYSVRNCKVTGMATSEALFYSLDVIPANINVVSNTIVDNNCKYITYCVNVENFTFANNLMDRIVGIIPAYVFFVNEPTGASTVNNNLFGSIGNPPSNCMEMTQGTSISSCLNNLFDEVAIYTDMDRLAISSPGHDDGDLSFLGLGDPEFSAISIFAGITKDLEEKNRIDGVRVDIGAYETASLTRIYVDESSSGGNDGSSWGNAYTDLQSALDIVDAGDTIVVAAGSYSPSAVVDVDESSTLDIGEETFQIPAGVKLWGSFIAGDNVRSQVIIDNRNFATNASILDGNGTSNHVVYTIDNGTETEVDGFTITGGNADGSGDNGNGAGWYNDAKNISSNPIIKNCVISQNNCSSNGAGFYNTSSAGLSASPSLIDCQFSSNRAVFDGGGFYNHVRGVGSVGSPSFTRVVFAENRLGTTGTNRGGAGFYSRIWDNGASATIEMLNVNFNSNTTGISTNALSIGGGGAIHLMSEVGTTTCTVSNSLFINNFALKKGSVAYVRATSSGSATLNLVNSTVTKNECNTGGGSTLQNGTLGANTINVFNTIVFNNITDAGDIDFNIGSGDIELSSSMVEEDEATLTTLGVSLSPNNIYNGTPDFELGTDYELSSTSLAINSGDNSLVGGSDKDIAGSDRIYDGVAITDIVDMGAFEFQGEPSVVIAAPAKVCVYSTTVYGLEVHWESVSGVSSYNLFHTTDTTGGLTPIIAITDTFYVFSQGTLVDNEINYFAVSGGGDTSSFVAAIPVNEAGKVLEFNGTSTEVKVLHSDELDLTGDLTIEAWVYPTDLTKANRILRKRNGGSGRGYGLGINVNKRLFFVYNGTSGGTITSSIIIEEDKWQHVAVTLEGQELSFYINGEFVESTNTGLPLLDTDQPLTIGGENTTGSGDFFEGAIDEVRIWDVVRTEEGINDNKDVPLKGRETGLVGLWHFDEPNGDIAYDASCNGNHGTHVNTPTIVDSRAMHPFAPQSLVASVINGDVALMWEDTITTDVVEYLVYKGLGAAPDTTKGIWVSISGLNTFYTEQDASGGDCDSVYYSIVGVDENGQIGFLSDTIAVFAGNPLLVTKTTDTPSPSVCGELRYAIEYANSITGLDTIAFDFTEITGPWIIDATLSSLPVITDVVVIDGWSEPSSDSSAPVIEINGTTSLSGLTLGTGSGGSVIRGLSITGFEGGAEENYGISIQDDNCSIYGNYLGLGLDGSTVKPNSYGITVVAASNNKIGVDASNTIANDLEKNVISGSELFGISMYSGSNDNVIKGNYIGFGADGETVLSSDNGIGMNVSLRNIIGGNTILERNYISANSTGIIIGGSVHDNEIYGNRIGVDINDIPVSPIPVTAILIGNDNRSNIIGKEIDDSFANILNGEILVRSTGDFTQDNIWGINTYLGQIVFEGSVQRGLNAPSVQFDKALLKVFGTVPDPGATIYVYADSSNAGAQYLRDAPTDMVGYWELSLTELEAEQLLGQGLNLLTAYKKSEFNTSEFGNHVLLDYCANSLIVTKTIDDGSCGTLRGAIDYVNDKGGNEIITFDFPTSDHTILLESSLSILVDDVVIDGGTSSPIIQGQAGFTFNTETNSHMLYLGAGSAELKGLILESVLGDIRGVEMNTYAPVIMDGVTVKDFSFAIDLSGSSSLTFENSMITSQYISDAYGITYIGDGSLNVINSSFPQLNNNGITIQGGFGSVKIQGNTFGSSINNTKVGLPINIESDHPGTINISDNLIEGNNWGAITIFGEVNARIEKNTIVGGTDGIFISNGVNSTMDLIENSISGITNTPIENPTVIYIPVIDEVSIDQTTVSGFFVNLPVSSGEYRIELFNTATDQADVFIDSAEVTVGMTGDWEITGLDPTAINLEFITATATYLGQDDGLQIPNTSALSEPVVYLPLTAVDDVIETEEDTPITFNVVSNDVSGSVITSVNLLVLLDQLLPIGILKDVTNGVLTVNPLSILGELTYTPNADFNGEDTFQYQIFNADGEWDTATVTITVNAVNDIPDFIIETNLTLIVDENTVDNPSGDLITNIVEDVDGDQLIVSTPIAQNGTVTLSRNLELLYSPNIDYSGTDTIFYQICSLSDCLNDTLIVTVVPLCREVILEKVGDDICEASTLELKVNGGNIGSTYTYQWYIENETNKIVGATSGIYNPLVPGTYYVTYTEEGGICEGTLSVIAENAVNASSITNTAGTLITTTTNGETGYQWYAEVEGALRAIVGETGSTYKTLFNGNYSVLISYNECELFTDQVIITGNANGSIARAGLEMTDTEIWIPSALEIKAEINLYPNPVDGGYFQTTFSSVNPTDFRVTVLTIEGKELFTKEVSKSGYKTNIDLNNELLKTGAYYIQVEQDGQQYLEKLMIY